MRRPGNSGIASAIRDLVIVVPFNDADAVARALPSAAARVAAMILEPVMMNAGIIRRGGYLAANRDLVHAEGALFDFRRGEDRLHHGAGASPRLTGGIPHGVPGQGAGWRNRAWRSAVRNVMSAIADGRYEQVGTFNGNPLAMAATRATLTDVLARRRTHTSRRCAARLRTSLEHDRERGSAGTW